MRRTFTTLLVTLVALCGLALEAAAQDPVDVTIREINAIPQENIDQLNAAGANLQSSDITPLIFNELNGQKVRFTAVVLSDPTNSGLSTPTDGLPSRVHVFVRDVNAETDGVEGMGIQLVDGSWETTGLLNVTVGDVITVVGTVSPFNTTLQVAPESIELLGTFESQGLSASILDPVIVTTADINKSIGPDGAVQVNWDNLPNLRGQYVRLENALVNRRDVSSSRPDWLLTTDGGVTSVSIYDTSLRYRNDRNGAYDPTLFNPRTDDFVPPPIGARVNLQGFLTYTGGAGSDPFGLAIPPGAVLAINPWEDSDLEITESPPAITSLGRPDFVPTTDPVTITFEAAADPTRTLARVELMYTTSASTDVVTVAATNTDGNTYTADIPPQPHGTFVTYWVEAEDDQGAVTTSDALSIRFMPDGFNKIEDIQLTVDQGEGESPFTGITLQTDITATVQSHPDASGFWIVQDDPDLGPWSGIAIEGTDAVVALNLQAGDVVRITGGTITELRGPDRFDRSGDVTGIATPTVEIVSQGGDPLGYKVMTTDVLQDEAIAEAHESMMLRFEDVVVTSPNADADIDRDFGEFYFSSDGTTENQLRSDDQSPLVEGGTTMFTGGERLDFLQGVWSHTFGNFKLMPEDPATDIGPVINVSTEGDELPDRLVLHQNYPNPFSPVTTIRYELARTGNVTLEVFDLLGRRVVTLVDGEQSVGAYNVRFDARGLSSGMYLYRLTAGSQVLTRTMLLLK